MYKQLSAIVVNFFLQQNTFFCVNQNKLLHILPIHQFMVDYFIKVFHSTKFIFYSIKW